MVTQQLLPDSEIKLMRLRQLADVFAMADSTLAGHRVRCTVEDIGNGIPAASTAGQIRFNPNAIPDVNTVEGLVKVNGLNFHELAHILHTPNKGPLLQHVLNDGNHQAFNVLEDQRIETLLVQQYPSIAPYLIATVAEYFVDVPPAQHETAYPYVYGRQYLPSNMIAFFKSKIPTGMTQTMQIETIIDEYKLIDVHDPNNTPRARKLIDRFATVVGKSQQHSPFGHQNASKPATGGSPGGSGSRAASSAQSQQAQQQSPSKGAGSQGKGGGPGEGGAGNTDLSNPKMDSLGSDQIKTKLKQIAQAQQGNQTVIDDVRRQREAMSMGAKFRGTLASPDRKETPVSFAAKNIARQFGKQLARLVAESDPGFHTHRASGKLNVQRAMHGASLDDVFDEWDAGKQDADSIEMVILMDSSGSMHGMIDETNEAMWILKTGCESLGRNASVSVIEFSNSSSYVYAPGVSASRTGVRSVGAGGGTNPQAGVLEAMRIFMNSTKKRKLCVFISDGGWSPGYGNTGVSAEEGIQRMNANGITTAAVFLTDAGHRRLMVDPVHADTYGSPSWNYASFGHGCQVFAMIDSTPELVTFGKKLVTQVMRTSK